MGTHPIFESDFDCLTEFDLQPIKMSDSAEVIDLSSKTVAELKAECKERNLPVSGKKSELIARLEDYMTKNEGAEITEDDLLEEPDVSLGEESQENESPPAEKAEEETGEDAPEAKVEITEEQRKLERAKKFGIEAPELVNDKKKSRAERFGLPASNGGGAKKGATPVDPEMDAKKKSRAERFGLTVNQKRKAKLEGTDIAIDAEKIKKRQERFGNISAAATDDKKSARAARFAAKV